MCTLNTLLAYLRQSIDAGEVDQAKDEAQMIVRFCRAVLTGSDLPGYTRPY
jgi:hypothetical protein